MARRKAAKRSRPPTPARKAAPKRGSAKRPRTERSAKRLAKPLARAQEKVARKTSPRKAAIPRKAAPPRKTTPARKAGPSRPAAKAKVTAARFPRLDRVRRTLEETVQTPPSSLDMERHGTAARSGRAEMELSLRNHHGMPQDITGGDVDVDVEDAYFTGDEAPGGDNPSPDLEVVDDIGKALGVQYDDNEELKGSEKVTERDKHRWEMDPASAEDYKERK